MHQQPSVQFVDLYDQYAASLYGLLLRSLPSEEQAQAALGEVFFLAYQYRAEMPAGYKLSWLLQLARRAEVPIMVAWAFSQKNDN